MPSPAPIVRAGRVISSAASSRRAARSRGRRSVALPALPTGRTLTVKEVARVLGIGEQTVRDLIHRGLLPAERPAYRWRIYESDLTAYRLAHRNTA